MVYNSSNTGTTQCPYYYGTANLGQYFLIYIGNSSGAIPNESIYVTVKDGTGTVLTMYLTGGHDFYNDGNDHEFEIIIDGVDNRIIADGVDVGTSFADGSVTSEYFTNMSADRLYLGKRDFSSGTFVTGNMWGLNISDTVIMPLSENGTFTNKIDGSKYNVTGTFDNSTQNKLHVNLENGL